MRIVSMSDLRKSTISLLGRFVARSHARAALRLDVGRGFLPEADPGRLYLRWLTRLLVRLFGAAVSSG
jgi:hypothetical protein